MVAHDVHGTERVDRRLAQSLDLLPLRDITHHGDPFDRGRHPCCGLFERRNLDVGHHDPHPLGTEPAGHGQTDATGRSGHDDDLPRQLLHEDPCAIWGDRDAPFARAANGADGISSGSGRT